MNRVNENMEPEDRDADRSLWQRCRITEAPDDEAARLLDLAAFADGLLDADERERVAALLSADMAAAADIAAARALTGGTGETPAGLERLIQRCCALVPDAAPASARVLAFATPMRRRILPSFAQWGSIAAAIAMASWLGFAMGSDASLAFSPPGQIGDEGFLNELVDPAIGFLRDLGESPRT